jgi:dimethylargininase
MRALTLLPGSTMNETNCELTYVEPQAIDTALALKQHADYRVCLEKLGFHVTCLAANEDLPDSVFIEDPVVILNGLAVLTLPGSASRLAEVSNIEGEIRKIRPVERIAPPGTLEGGDVLCIGQRIFVGISTRTNEVGVEQFRKYVAPLGFEVAPVRVPGALHLKTAVTALDDSTLLVNKEWVDPRPFEGFRMVDVPATEPFAANIISVGRQVLMHEGFTETRALVESLGFEVLSLNISEFLKAEAGLTCMSVRFR